MVKGFPSLLVLVLVASFVPSAALAQTLEPYEVMRALRGRDGADSQSGLVRGADDHLYGTATTGGGPNGAGTIFRITTGGVFDVVYRFLTTAPENGINPVSLMRGRDNHLYGTTDYGGRLSSGATVDADGNPAGDGIIYRLHWNATTLTYSGITVLHTFDCSAGDGGDPWGTLVEGPDGALYGMTIPSWRPDPDCTDVSTVFKLNKDGTGFEVLARFDYLDTGSNQFGPLAFGSDGSIFGTLTDSVNTEYQFGSIFKIAPDGTVSYPKIFEGSDGAFPFSGVVRGVDGAFYGTTLAGGSYDAGTIFRIEEDGDFASLYSFDPSSIHTPYSPVVVGGDGTLYGAAHAGGGSPGCGLDAAGNPYGCGGTYVFDPPSPIGSGAGFSLHSTFDHTTTGSSPWGPLGVGADRHLYGTQSAGGSGSQGTIFGLLNIEVADRPPVPFAMVSPNPAEALTPQGATVSLNALGSWDADFDSLTYAWILPDAAIPVSGDPAATPVISATFPEGTWLVGLNVTAGGATSSLTIPVTVIDEPPVFGAVSPVSAPATLLSSGEIGAIVDYPLPAANDRVDGDRSAYVECLPASGLAFLLGSTTVECSVSDTRGHVATTSFVVTVTPAVTLNVPANQTIEATGASGAAFSFTVSATSAAGATLTPVCSHESGSIFAMGSTTVQCSAVDSATSLDATASFIVNVVDTTPPTITMDINGIEYNSEGPHGADIQYYDPSRVNPGDSPSAYDVVDGVVDVVCDPPPGIFPLGRTRVTCTAVDAGGNESVFRFDVVVRDSDEPVLSLPDPIIVEAQNVAGAVVTFTATATDRTSPDGITVVCIPQSGSTFPLGTTTVTCTATDGAGSVPESHARTSTGSFVVTVRDTTPPMVVVPAPMTVLATGPGGAVVGYTASASDSASIPTVSCVPASGSTFPLGTTTVQCTATDGSGNQTAGSFAVNVVEPDPTTTAPTLSITLSPGVLWPPNHKMVTINATVIAASEDGTAPVVTLESITSNEPDNGLGDGDTQDDIQGATYGTSDTQFQLRAERNLKGTGRVYTVTYKAVNPLNPALFTTTSATVTVPHDMKGKTN